MGRKDNTTSSLFPPNLEKDRHWEKWPIFRNFVFQFSVVFETKRLPLVASLLVICFMMSMKNSNSWDEILIILWDWQREGMRITDEIGKGIGIKPGWVWEGELEWEWTIGNGQKWDWNRHCRSSLVSLCVPCSWSSLKPGFQELKPKQDSRQTERRDRTYCQAAFAGGHYQSCWIVTWLTTQSNDLHESADTIGKKRHTSASLVYSTRSSATAKTARDADAWVHRLKAHSHTARQRALTCGMWMGLKFII